MPEGCRQLAADGRSQPCAFRKAGLSNREISRRLGRAPVAGSFRATRGRGVPAPSGATGGDGTAPRGVVGRVQDDAGEVGVGRRAAEIGWCPEQISGDCRLKGAAMAGTWIYRLVCDDRKAVNGLYRSSCRRGRAGSGGTRTPGGQREGADSASGYPSGRPRRRRESATGRSTRSWAGPTAAPWSRRRTGPRKRFCCGAWTGRLWMRRATPRSTCPAT